MEISFHSVVSINNAERRAMRLPVSINKLAYTTGRVIYQSRCLSRRNIHRKFSATRPIAHLLMIIYYIISVSPTDKHLQRRRVRDVTSSAIGAFKSSFVSARATVGSRDELTLTVRTFFRFSDRIFLRGAKAGERGGCEPIAEIYP